VEYQLSTVNQIQVNEKVGLVFSKGLRSILRQDPDIIMVGEMRDAEAAQIAIQSALTGHLVFSTLHTNDAPGAIVRMADMGIEPYLIVATVIGVLAQRLIRKICSACKQAYDPSPELLNTLDYSFPPGTKFYRGNGCDECLRSGYKGRMGIYELMTVTPKIKRLVLSRAPESAIRDSAIEEGLITLRKAGLAKVVSGITTLEEVMRVTYAEDKTVDLHSDLIREVNA
jgi:general secretion pathway protein E